MPTIGRSSSGYSPKPWIVKRIRNEYLRLTHQQIDNTQLAECKEIAFGCPKGDDLPYFPEMDTLIHPITDGQVIIFAAFNPRLVRNTRSAYQWSNDGSAAGYQVRIERCRVAVMDAVVDTANTGQTRGHLSGRSLVLIVDLFTVREDKYTAEKAVWYTEVDECRRDVEFIITEEIRARNNKAKFLCVDLTAEQRRLDRLVRPSSQNNDKNLQCHVDVGPLQSQNTSLANQSSPQVEQFGESIGFTIESPEITSQTEIPECTLKQDQISPSSGTAEPETSSISSENVIQSHNNVNSGTSLQTDTNLVVPETPLNLLETAESSTVSQIPVHPQVPEENPKVSTRLQVPKEDNPQVPVEGISQVPMEVDTREESFACCLCETNSSPIRMPIIKSSSLLPTHRKRPRQSGNQNHSSDKCFTCLNPLSNHGNFHPRQTTCLKCRRTMEDVPHTRTSVVFSSRFPLGKGLRFDPLPENNWQQLRKDWALLLSVLVQPQTADSEESQPPNNS